MQKELFINNIRQTIEKLNNWPNKKIKLFHHNDTDGLTSGTILQTALTRAGFEIERYSLEKPYPQVLEKIFTTEKEIIIFTDFAGKIAPLICDLNKDKNLVIILDHHTAEKSTSELVHNLDGELYGIRGDRDISGSTTCYAFVKELNNQNKDLAPLAVLGAVGDGFYEKGCLVEFNREAVLDAQSQNLLRIKKNQAGEKYYIKINNQEYLCNDLAESLDIIGAVAYYQGGTDLGVQICQKGLNKEIEKEIENYANIRDEIFEKEILKIKNGEINSSKNIDWINVEDRFKPMGVKMIGVFLNTIKNMDFVNKEKYLAGYQNIPDEIPKFGKIKFNQTKISMRVSDELEKAIKAKEKTGLNIFLPEATINLGGFVDACHSVAAATTVKIGEEEKLINEMEQVLKKYN